MKRLFFSYVIVLICIFFSVQVVLSQEFTVQVGEEKVFTTFNYFDDNLFSGGGGIPLPTYMVSISSGNQAETEIVATPNTNGIAQAFIGLVFNIDTSGYEWEKIKYLPVHVEVNFAYSLYASCNGWGSADAEIALHPFTTSSYWFDNIFFTSVGEDTSGFMTPQTKIAMFTIEDIKSFGEMIRFHIYSHAHLALNDFGVMQNAASAMVSLDSIKITAAAIPDMDIDCDTDGNDLARLAQTYGTGKNDFNFNPLCDFVFDGAIDEKDLGLFALNFGKSECTEQM